MSPSTSAGDVKVLDFGLAKQLNVEPKDATDPERQTLLTSQTQEGVIVGTPCIFRRSKRSVLRSTRAATFSRLDLCFTSALPAGRRSTATRAWISARKSFATIPLFRQRLIPTFPDMVDRITMKALAKQPAERYQTAM
jgi:hypothetical protein